MVNVYEICFYGGLILAILLFITTIVLFFVMKIPKVIGELTGSSAKKSIRERRNEKVLDNSISKKEQAKYYNQSTGKITVRDSVTETSSKQAKASEAASLSKTSTEGFMGEEATEVLGAGRFAGEEATEVLGAGRFAGEEATEVLGAGRFAGEEATEVLGAGSLTEEAATEVLGLQDYDEATDVLATEDYDDEATDVLVTQDSIEETTDILKSEDLNADMPTDVLRTPDAMEATTVLAGNEADKLAERVRVICNIVITHTDEKL